MEAATRFVEDRGLAGFSVRACANAIGTSHRMLLHHFGTKEHLLAAVIAELRRRWLEQAAAEVDANRATPTDQGRTLWSLIAGDRDRLALVLQIVGVALLDPDRFGDIVVQSTQQWISATEAMLGSGLEPERRRAIATMVVAALGGLQIDLLVTNDEDRIRSAFGALEQCVALLLNAALVAEEGATS